MQLSHLNGDKGENLPGKVHTGPTSSSPRPPTKLSPHLCWSHLCSPDLLQISLSLLPVFTLLPIAFLISWLNLPTPKQDPQHCPCCLSPIHQPHFHPWPFPNRSHPGSTLSSRCTITQLRKDFTLPIRSKTSPNCFLTYLMPASMIQPGWSITHCRAASRSAPPEPRSSEGGKAAELPNPSFSSQADCSAQLYPFQAAVLWWFKVKGGKKSLNN